MKTAKWSILISLLLLLLAGAVLLDPLFRFTMDLHREQFTGAGAVYAAHLAASETRRRESAAQLKAYVEDQLQRYYAKEISFDRIMGILSALSKTGLPQQDVSRCRHDAEKMEQARTDLAQADALYQQGDYGSAIPLYRKSLIADEGAPYRLMQAEALYKNTTLDQAEADMADGRYDDAEAVLSACLSILEGDMDLSTALADVGKLKAGQIYHGWTEEARRLLTAEDPEKAFAFVADLREQSPDSYELEYLDQLIRHEYEADILSRAQSMREVEDLDGACALLEEALLWIDSEQVKALRAEIRTAMTFYLVDRPILRDETTSPRTGAISTVARDQVLSDVQANEFAHSLWADAGSVTFALDEDFTTFAGTVAFPQGEKADLYRASATLQIFGDGILLAEFKDMDDASAPLPFSLPISGVKELTLAWTSKGASGWKDWGRFATVFDGRFLVAATDQP